MDENTAKTLIRKAIAVLPRAYAPYSRFHVGAAVLCSSGRIYTGVNAENASYPAGICAERSAIACAAAEGERTISAIAIVGGKADASGTPVITDYCPPCGICRQVIREFGDPQTTVIVLAKTEDDYLVRTLDELLPLSFGPSALQ